MGGVGGGGGEGVTEGGGVGCGVWFYVLQTSVAMVTVKQLLHVKHYSEVMYLSTKM